MQAEVTGKLKQHFNNALPKQNSTTTGVSVIMNTALDKEGQIFCGKLGPDSGRPGTEPASPPPPAAPAPPESAAGRERAGPWRRHRD